MCKINIANNVKDLKSINKYLKSLETLLSTENFDDNWRKTARLNKNWKNFLLKW